MDYHNIYKKVERYVTDLFVRNASEVLVFHNLAHTMTVVERAKEIAGHYNLSERDMLTLYVAAWFHDTGHLFTEPRLHEAKSVEIMREFMQQYTTDEELLKNIEDCILATRRAVEPQGILQQIMCDADTYHLGTKDFKHTNKQVKKEEKLRNGNIGPDWDSRVVKFLENHKYYTTYARELLTETKYRNMAKAKNKQAEEVEEGESGSGPKITEANGLMSKGIQTMLRLTSDNHLELSGMADGKANILISVNAIIISVILSVLLRRLETDPYLTVPTVVFLAFSVTTIVIAILSTRPKLTEGRFTMEDVAAKKTNLLFFGNFHKATLQEYERAMRHMMRDSDYLYGSLIKDIYYLGVVLGRKYKLIRLAYNVFMIGIIVSVLAFTFAVLFFSNHAVTANNPAVSPL
jgi:HD superfamily phosphodiesterase